MDVAATVDRLVADLPATVDPGTSSYVRELIAVGEHDIALVTLIELVPAVGTTDLLDQVERHYRGSGNYVEPQALTAIERFRSAAL